MAEAHRREMLTDPVFDICRTENIGFASSRTDNGIDPSDDDRHLPVLTLHDPGLGVEDRLGHAPRPRTPTPMLAATPTPSPRQNMKPPTAVAPSRIMIWKMLPRANHIRAVPNEITYGITHLQG